MATEVAGRTFGIDRDDFWNNPSCTAYSRVNDTNDLQVRLTFSNAAHLEKLNVYVVDGNAPAATGDPMLSAPGWAVHNHAS